MRKLTNKFDQLSSKNNGNRDNNSTVLMLNGKVSNLCNVKQKDVTIHADENALKGMIAKGFRILVVVIKKRLPTTRNEGIHETLVHISPKLVDSKTKI